MQHTSRKPDVERLQRHLVEFAILLKVSTTLFCAPPLCSGGGGSNSVPQVINECLAAVAFPAQGPVGATECA